MPSYDFKCTKCENIEERFMSQRAFVESNEQINCGECGEAATYVASFWYTSVANAQRFSPVVIHRDAEGNIRFPGNVNSPVPEGFEKVELRDFQQIRKFEKEVNDKERRKIDEHQGNKAKFLDHHLEGNREAMREIVSRFSPRGRRFYESMREVSEQKQKQFRGRANSPNFYIEAFSMDSSNRDGYHDGDYGKGSRK